MNRKIIILFFGSFISFPSTLIFSQDALSQAIQNKYSCGSADFIIVGVGTAGALMANRLSNDLKTSVIALHSGEDLNDDPLIKFSRNAAITVASAILPNSPFYQNGETVQQPNANNRKVPWAVALPEAGASSINAGAYCRETPFINDQWEAITGSPNWSNANILNVYKSLETYTGQTENPSARGFSGPINVRQATPISVLSQKFTNAIVAGTGVPQIDDYNDPDLPIGASPQFQYTQNGNNGELRVSSATAFLNESVVTPSGQGLNGRKLQILFGSTALRTIWNGNKAIGVEYLQNNITKQVFANKGVIVCAGLKSSPFLMLSGIGPSSLLNNLSIPIKFDNPNVGQNLTDQPNVLLTFSSDPEDTQIPSVDPGLFSQIAWLPDPTGDPNIRALRFATVNPLPGITFALFDLVAPKSRGSVTIGSADPLANPIIDTGLLTNSDDLELYIRGFQNYISNINNYLVTNYPGYKLISPNPLILSDTNALTTFIQNTILSNQHFQSHCRMAPLNQGGVVDSMGRVYGVQNLFVADDSIIPLGMDGSPMASAYLMAQIIANIIIQTL